MKLFVLIVFLGAFNALFAQFDIPQWSNNASIYEVNIRQFTPEGTFKAFQSHLPRIKDMGIDVVWLMPIHPIGVKNRKGSLGSYYAVKDYQDVNPEFGSKQDFADLVLAIHNLGMKVIIDWVANHSSPDNVWVEQENNKSWYTLDSLGNLQPTIGTDWWDVADLNYDNYEMRLRMIESMKYWVEEYNIDGFRCDVASWVPIDFWKDARKVIESVKPIFFLAEAEGDEMYEAFDMTYGWEFHHIMNKLVTGEKKVKDVYTFFEKRTPKIIHNQMQFTSNHDENSWNGTVQERLGEARFGMAVLASTIDGMPLVYNGQESSLDKRLAFFEKDSIDWSKMDLVSFYSKLLHLKKDNPALNHSGESKGSLHFVKVPSNPNLLIYKRAYKKNQVLVVINTSDKDINVEFADPLMRGNYTDLFSNKKIRLKKKNTLDIEAWGYRVYHK